MADKSSIPQDIPWGPVGYITYKRTYSRPVKGGKTEEWSETIERVVKACRTQLDVGFTEKEENDVRDMMMSLKGTVAGRFLWQLGTKTVDRLGLPSLQNCAFVVCDRPIRPFTWTFEMLMLGSGVGFNIQREHVYQIPKILKKVKIERKDVNDADFIVPDSREGWVELLRRVLEASFVTGEGFTFACHLIRSKGSPIKGFGGVASGPEDLVWGMFEINKLLNSRSGKRLRPIDCLDIMNIIGRIVVAGNVRRSAQIAIGDYDDIEYLRAKRWDLGGIPNWRSMSNNSVACDDISLLPEEFWEGYKGNGEPYGLINLDALPVGDHTRSNKELLGNESQERMGLIVSEKNLEILEKIAKRERSPIYVVGKVTNDNKFIFESPTKGTKPMDLNLEDMFGSSPKTIMIDQKIKINYNNINYDKAKIEYYLEQVLK